MDSLHRQRRTLIALAVVLGVAVAAPVRPDASGGGVRRCADAHCDVRQPFQGRSERAGAGPCGSRQSGVQPGHRGAPRLQLRWPHRTPHPGPLRPPRGPDQHLRGSGAVHGRRVHREEYEPASIDELLAVSNTFGTPAARAELKDAAQSDLANHDIPIPLNQRVLSYIELFQGRLHDFIEQGMRRGSKYCR